MPKLSYAVVFSCILVIGLPLNAVSLWVLLRHHGCKSPNAIFMINLAISDLLLAITLPMRVYFYATGVWPLGETACIMITMLFRKNILSSSIFITFISVDRLLAVVYPLRSRHIRTTRNAVKGAVVVWLFNVLLSIPESMDFSENINRHNDTTVCFESVNGARSAASHIQLFVIFSMLVVNIVSTVMVFWTLRGHLSEAAKVNNKVNVMVIFAVNLAMFIICFLPVVLIPAFRGSDRTLNICLASVNCCLDPLLYYFSLDAFWKKKEDTNVRGEHVTNDTEFY